MQEKVKVLIVDDSAFMRKIISDFIQSDIRLQVVGTARNGEDALQKIIELAPDVVTMDVEMPVMDGLEALSVIMNKKPLPVVMLSSTTSEGAMNALKAIELGAIDFITKPSGAISLDLHKVKEEIIEKVYVASKVNVAKISNMQKSYHVKQVTQIQQRINQQKKIICIGTSTGGPRALQEVLSQIPPSINAPLLIVQHMPVGFTKSLADRLNGLCSITVKEAEHGEIIKNGVAYIAPGGFHLKVREVGHSVAIELNQSDPKNGHRPSVDVLFESVSTLTAFHKVAVIMTGMGQDGAHGLTTLKKTGEVRAIAEAEESCVVFGMPKAAIRTSCIDEVVELQKIAFAILRFI